MNTIVALENHSNSKRVIITNTGMGSKIMFAVASISNLTDREIRCGLKYSGSFVDFIISEDLLFTYYIDKVVRTFSTPTIDFQL